MVLQSYAVTIQTICFIYKLYNVYLRNNRLVVHEEAMWIS